MRAPSLATNKGFWLSHLTFNCPLITHSLPLSFSNVSTELSNSCLISEFIETLCSHFSNSQYLASSPSAFPASEHHRSSPLMRLFTFSLLPIPTYVWNYAYFTPPPGMQSSLPAGQQVIQIQNPMLTLALSDHSSHQLPQVWCLKKQTQMQMRAEALILLLSSLPPAPGCISEDNISCCKIRIHSNSDPI